MKKTIISMVVMITAAVSLHAQEPVQPHQQQHKNFRHHERGMIAKKLNFSDQQKEQLKNINTDYRNKLTELKKHEEISVKEMKTQLKTLHKDHKAQLQALLTPEQKDKLDRMKADRMEMAKANATARAEKLKIKLGLSDEQAGKLRTLRTDLVAKMKAVHTDNSLSREQKREQFKSLVTAQQAQLKDILTAKQLQQLEQLKQQRHRRDFSR